MLSSRISLSLFALSFSGMVNLAWVSKGGLGATWAPADEWLMQSFVLVGICLFCIFFWCLNFFRDPDYNYLLSSRLVLSVLSLLFGYFAIAALMHFDIVRPINLAALSTVAYCAYICGMAGLVVLWLTVYLRSRGLFGGWQADRTFDQHS